MTGDDVSAVIRSTAASLFVDAMAHGVVDPSEGASYQ